MSSTDQTKSDGAAAGGAAKELCLTPDSGAIEKAVPAVTSQTALPPQQAALDTERSTYDHRVSVSVAHDQLPIQQQPVRLVKEKDGQWALARDGRFVNNLSWVVGFLELANAGDFAANVWNTIPVPVYAIVFMAIGATVAGFLSIFAFRDAARARYNVRYLKMHRKKLHEEKKQLKLRSESTLETDVILAINFRELGTEIVARFGMDILMGFGAVMICVGTYMAIGGANHAVFLASNLLSGYIGNTPIALFGLVNSSWAVFIFCIAQSHVKASRKLLGPCRATALVKRRARKVQVFCAINGTATILGGVGSMLTVTQWWGYVILIPVIISSFFCNAWWRKMIGYTRSEGHPAMIREELIYALEFAAVAAQVKTSKNDSEALPPWCSDLPDSLADMIDFLSCHSLLHQYCLEMIKHPEMCKELGGDAADVTELCISPQDILGVPATLHPTLVDLAKTVVRKVGTVHFKNRERYLAELLGTYCAVVPRHDDAQGAGRRESTTEKI